MFTVTMGITTTDPESQAQLISPDRLRNIDSVGFTLIIAKMVGLPTRPRTTHPLHPFLQQPPFDPRCQPVLALPMLPIPMTQTPRRPRSEPPIARPATLLRSISYPFPPTRRQLEFVGVRSKYITHLLPGKAP